MGPGSGVTCSAWGKEEGRDRSEKAGEKRREGAELRRSLKNSQKGGKHAENGGKKMCSAREVENGVACGGDKTRLRIARVLSTEGGTSLRVEREKGEQEPRVGGPGATFPSRSGDRRGWAAGFALWFHECELTEPRFPPLLYRNGHPLCLPRCLCGNQI